MADNTPPPPIQFTDIPKLKVDGIMEAKKGINGLELSANNPTKVMNADINGIEDLHSPGI